jgi:para-nitrobenzyl esterase
MNPLVETRYGKLQGGKIESVCYWKGVPYAKAPVGELRFQPPQPPEPWTGVRDATKFGSVAMQPADALFGGGLGRVAESGSEDCLFLNIWSPGADGKKRPVMVWIHGGAFLFGSGSMPWYDGTQFAKHGDVVVVTINYRMNVFGFLHLAELFGEDYGFSGNCGILDQVAALRWVKENIEAFGGDPKQITIFGESAGAASVGVLLAMPEAKGLFQRAILQSGSGSLLLNSAAKAGEKAEKILHQAGIRPGDRDRLLTISAQELLQAALSLDPRVSYGPVVDGRALPHHPIEALKEGAARDIPILIGVTKDEYNLFTITDPTWTALSEQQLLQRIYREVGPVPQQVVDYYLHAGDESEPTWQKLLRIMTYRVFTNGMLRTADYQVEQGAKVWMYRFDYETPVLGGKLKACHTLELPFVFANLHQPGIVNFTGDSPNRERISKQMHHAWISFARSGDPNHDSLPEKWQAYDFEKRAVMIFDASSHMAENLFGEERAVWEKEKAGG